jgi:biotin operon repressor
MRAEASVVDDADWASVSDVARQRGVTRQAISKRVKHLSGRGELSTRGEGRALRFHLPTFDALTAAAHDPAQDLRNRHQRSAVVEADAEPGRSEAAKDKRQTPASAPELANSSSYDAASAREKNAKAELAEMELARRRAELVPAGELADAALQVATTIAQHVASLKRLAGKLYAAAHTGGEDAVQMILVEEVDRIIANSRRELMRLAADDLPESSMPVAAE